MLKSYKILARWYPALEPLAATDPGIPAGGAPAPAPRTGEPAVKGGSYPYYITDTAPEPVPPPYTPESGSRRGEFSGGWTDWVGARAPGPDAGHPAGPDADLIRLPWSDEEFDGDPARRTPGAVGRSLRDRIRPRRRPLQISIAVALLGVSAAVTGYSLQAHQDSPRHTDAPGVRLSAAGLDESGAGRCVTERTDEMVRGAEPGGTGSGPDAVLWFQHSYYVERSAQRAREVVAPGAAVPSAAVIQRGIDSVPAGTDYCVRVVTVTPERFAVAVTEYRPDGGIATYGGQVVTTAVVGGRTLITSITAG
ncbi:hypothetical protein [Nocardia stercoris]|uniref:DUF8176 domain-containing protein n=1 Tax=Nocardia stercoris TaxID=2483361 RepID=A0A3M2KYN4_9NOCA|nr:hypothetical protein [Nocardia stercoris]RMI30607.1 hypothetical protein EBN03_21315 [Nocardia stercoris]